MDSSDVEVALPAAAVLGEGPIWDPSRGVLWWVDILAGLVHRFDPATGEDTVFDAGLPVGALAPRAAGGLVLATRDGFATCDESGAHVELVVPVEADDSTRRMNDGKCDPAGRFWAGTMSLDERAPSGSLYCLDPSLTVRTAVEGVTISNGLGWSPDGRTMYYIDTPAGGVDAFDYDVDTGGIANRRRVVDIDRGHPDGMTVDADGCLWVALWGGWGVRRYTPDGRLDNELALPVEHVTSCAFGGPGLDTLFITTAKRDLSDAERAAHPLAGDLFCVTPGSTGLPPAPFAG